jgi:hypothetical protein
MEVLMRTKWLVATLLSLSSSLVGAAPPDNAGPRHKAVIVCFNGKDQSGSLCSVSNFQPDGTFFKMGKLTCGYPAKVSEIEWTFIGRREGKDTYRFTRRFPIDAALTTTAQKEIEFAGNRVKVFEDDSQCIVMEKPGKHGS